MAQARDSLFGVLPTPINLPHPYAQAPEPTKAPRRPARRQQSSSSDPGTIYYAPDNTCGYVDGVKSNYFACDQGSTCVIYTSTLGVPGHIMCQIRDHYQLRTACINSSDQCDDDCASNTAKLKCTNSDAPYCNTVDFPESVTGWMCSSRSNTVPFNAQITFSGQKGRTLSPFKLGQPQTQSQSASSSSSSDLSSSSDISSTSKALPSFSSKPGATEATHTAATTDAYSGGGGSNNHSGSKNESSKTNIGAIAGGTVGGVVGLALIGAGLFFFLRRKKTKTPTPVAEPKVAEKKPALYGGPEQPPAELHSGSGQYPHGAAELYSPEPVYEAPGHPVPRT